MSLLVVERKKVPIQEFSRKLIITSRKHIQKGKKNQWVLPLTVNQIPGWTETVNRIQVTSYVGQVKYPFIYTSSYSGREIYWQSSYYHSPGFSNFFLKIGTELIYVTSYISSLLQERENIQLWHNLHSPIAIYSSDRDILWTSSSLEERRAFELFEP
ncbi:MAG: hypothetical protein ACFFCH_00425 [Promethearchaeota archaeon]